MRPCPLPAHDRNDPPRQIVPAEEIGFELRAKRLDRQVLYRTRLGISAIVEERVEPTVREAQDTVRQCGNRFRLGIVEIESLKPLCPQGGGIPSLRAVAKPASPGRAASPRNRPRCRTNSR